MAPCCRNAVRLWRWTGTHAWDHLDADVRSCDAGGIGIAVPTRKAVLPENVKVWYAERSGVSMVRFASIVTGVVYCAMALAAHAAGTPPIITSIEFADTIEQGVTEEGFVHFEDPDRDITTAQFGVVSSPFLWGGPIFSPYNPGVQGRASGAVFFTLRCNGNVGTFTLSIELTDAQGNSSGAQPFTSTCVAPPTTTTTTTSSTTTTILDYARADVAFVIDGSDGMSSGEFERQKAGIIDSIDDAAVLRRDGSVGVTVLQYGSGVAAGARVEVPYRLVRSEADADALADAVDAILPLGGAATPGDALAQAGVVLASSARPDAGQIVCLLASGPPTVGMDIVTGSDQARSNGIDRLAIAAVDEPDYATVRAAYKPAVFGGGTIAIVSSVFELGSWTATGCLMRRVKLEALEVTQSIQDLENSVPLVADKITYVRAHVRPASGTTSPVRLSARLLGSRAGQQLPGSPLVPINEDERVSVDPGADRGEFSDTLNFYLPKEWRSEGELQLELDTVGSAPICSEPGTPDCKVDVTFMPSAVPDVTFYGVRWTQRDRVESETLDTSLIGIAPYVRAMFPIAAIDDDYDHLALECVGTTPTGTPPALPTGCIHHFPSVETVLDALDDIRDRAFEACGTPVASPGPSWDTCVARAQSRLYQGVAPGYCTEDCCSGDDGNAPCTGAGSPMACCSGPGAGTCPSCPPGQDDPPGGRAEGHDETDQISTITPDYFSGAAHELGHTLGRAHSGDYCGAEGGEDFPYETVYETDFSTVPPKITYAPALGPVDLGPERLAYGLNESGYSLAEPAVLPPDEYYDVMGYCFPQWTSIHTYNAVFDVIRNRFGATAGRSGFVAVATVSDTLVIRGAINPGTGEATFRAFGTLPGSFPVPTEGPGSYHLVLRTAGGDVLLEVPFEPRWSEAVGASGGVGRFSIGVPADLPIASVTVELEGSALATRARSANPPEVTLVTPNGGEQVVAGDVTVEWQATDADGDALSYALQYSADDGASWKTIAVGLTSTTIAIPWATLAGTSAARMRVEASDGFDVASDASDAPFVVAQHSPSVDLVTPSADSHFAGRQLVVLRADAYDREDGRLSPPALVWTSSVDGPLGAGTEIARTADTLSEGSHVLTVTATDGSGLTAQDTVQVRIVRASPAVSCPGVENEQLPDGDLDGLGDPCDSCTDSDGDGYGDHGYDGNSCVLDNCPGTYNAGQEDTDHDGWGDMCNGCGTLDAATQFSLLASEGFSVKPTKDRGGRFHGASVQGDTCGLKVKLGAFTAGARARAGVVALAGAGQGVKILTSAVPGSATVSPGLVTAGSAVSGNVSGIGTVHVDPAHPALDRCRDALADAAAASTALAGRSASALLGTVRIVPGQVFAVDASAGALLRADSITLDSQRAKGACTAEARAAFTIRAAGPIVLEVGKLKLGNCASLDLPAGSIINLPGKGSGITIGRGVGGGDYGLALLAPFRSLTVAGGSEGASTTLDAAWVKKATLKGLVDIARFRPEAASTCAGD